MALTWNAVALSMHKQQSFTTITVLDRILWHKLVERLTGFYVLEARSSSVYHSMNEKCSKIIMFF